MKSTLIVANFLDGDALYGHNLPETGDFAGMMRSIENIDQGLGIVWDRMGPHDLLIVTADHGMEYREGDYGYHHKEAVPLLATMKAGTCEHLTIPSFVSTFAVVGDLAAQHWGIQDQYREQCHVNLP